MIQRALLGILLGPDASAPALRASLKNGGFLETSSRSVLIKVSELLSTRGLGSFGMAFLASVIYPKRCEHGTFEKGMIKL